MQQPVLRWKAPKYTTGVGARPMLMTLRPALRRPRERPSTTSGPVSRPSLPTTMSSSPFSSLCYCSLVRRFCIVFVFSFFSLCSLFHYFTYFFFFFFFFF